jgi:hypothetical protein
MGIHNLPPAMQFADFPTGGATPTKLLKTADGYLLAYGTTVPSDAATGYAPGAIFIHTDGNDNDSLYVNDGTEASADFNVLASNIPTNLAGLTATVAEINQACDESANVEVLAATEVLVAADSGKTLFLNHATEFDTKLPAPAAGLRFKFIVTAAPSGANYTITTNGTTQNVIFGSVSSSDLDAGGDAALTNATGVDVVTFVASKAKIGDWVEVISDGTNWYLQGACQVFDAITLA